jgi:hypothetical protein
MSPDIVTGMIVYAVIGLIYSLFCLRDDQKHGHNIKLADLFVVPVAYMLVWPLFAFVAICESYKWNIVIVKGKE